MVTGNKNVLGAKHLDTLQAKMNLAIFYDGQGDVKAEYHLYREVHEPREEKLTSKQSYTLRILESLTATMQLLGDPLEAEGLALEALHTNGTASEKE